MMKKDNAIDQIHQIRSIISKENGHDPQRLVNYYIELQKQYPELAQFQEPQTKLVRSL